MSWDILTARPGTFQQDVLQNLFCIFTRYLSSDVSWPSFEMSWESGLRKEFLGVMVINSSKRSLCKFLHHSSRVQLYTGFGDQRHISSHESKMFGDSDLRNAKFCQLHLKYLIKTLHKPMSHKAVLWLKVFFLGKWFLSKCCPYQPLAPSK